MRMVLIFFSFLKLIEPQDIKASEYQCACYSRYVLARVREKVPAMCQDSSVASAIDAQQLPCLEYHDD